MIFSPSTVLVGTLLVLLQVLAALPWVAVLLFTPDELVALRRAWSWRNKVVRFDRLVRIGAVWLFSLVLGVLSMTLEHSVLEIVGRVYGAVLQLQLTIDFFIIFIAVMLRAWPKGGAVALAAFREGIRQPLFWMLFGIAVVAMTVFIFVPYFTFGEDHIMVKELGFDTIMVVGALFGALAASMFISEEIEGRTAVTLMSKPVSRRQFLLGKFVGILLGILLMFGLLGCWFEGIVIYKAWLDRVEWFDYVNPTPTTVPWVTTALGKMALSGPSLDILRGLGFWVNLTFETLPGLILSFVLVMVLVALAVALATRVPMVVNLCAVLAVYFLANLSPVLVSISEKARHQSDAGAVAQILSFTSQLFDTLLPGLSYFRIGPALSSDTALPPGPFWIYVGVASIYGLMYTGILLLLGLILFEDRDLA